MRGQKVNDQPFLLMNLKFKNYNFISIKSKNCIVRILNSIFFLVKDNSIFNWNTWGQKRSYQYVATIET